MNTFLEIHYPELVSDVKDIYWEHIHPIGLKAQGNYIKSVLIKNNDIEYEALSSIVKKYNFLSRHLLLIKLDPNFSTPVHLDGAEEGRRRAVSFNIPISGCNGECVTEFYNNVEDDFIKDVPKATRWLKDGVSAGLKIGEYRLTENPIMICPQTPHRVNNLEGDSVRLTVSWTLRLDWNFNQAAEYFKLQNRII